MHDKDLAKELYKKYSAVRVAFVSLIQFLDENLRQVKPPLTLNSGFSVTDP